MNMIYPVCDWSDNRREFFVAVYAGAAAEAQLLPYQIFNAFLLCRSQAEN
jgi:hypothetical protein